MKIKNLIKWEALTIIIYTIAYNWVTWDVMTTPADKFFCIVLGFFTLSLSAFIFYFLSTEEFK